MWAVFSELSGFVFSFFFIFFRLLVMVCNLHFGLHFNNCEILK